MRLRVPDDGETVVHDLIRGPVKFPNRSYDNFVVARGNAAFYGSMVRRWWCRTPKQLLVRHRPQPRSARGSS